MSGQVQRRVERLLREEQEWTVEEVADY